jgi:hypothetical protein
MIHGSDNRLSRHTFLYWSADKFKPSSFDFCFEHSSVAEPERIECASRIPGPADGTG